VVLSECFGALFGVVSNKNVSMVEMICNDLGIKGDGLEKLR